MDYKAKKYKTLCAALMTLTVILTAALATVRTLMLAWFYNTETGYFNCDDVYTTVFYLCEALCLVIAIAALVTLGKKIRIAQPAPSSVSLFAGLFCGFLMAASVALYFLETPIDAAFGSYLVIIALVLALVSAVYFLLGATAQKLGYTVKSLLCFAVILWAMVNLFVLYFDITLTINNPAKIAEQLALVSVMLYFLYECRFFLEKQRPAVYLAIGFISCVLLGVSVVPNIISAFFLGVDVSTGFYTQISELGIFVYVLFRTVSNIKNIDIKAPEA